MTKIAIKHKAFDSFQELLLLFKGVINLEANFIDDLIADTPLASHPRELGSLIYYAEEQG